MEFDFLKGFEERMKRVGTYALLYKNSMQKTTWKNYGFDEFYEQSNIIFALLLYVMEQSLKEEYCTMDHISSFLDNINQRYFKKPLSYEECKELGEFIVNTVLCDDGKAMYFDGYNFEEGEYESINISFLGNKIVYIDEVVRRTSYYLTNDGYSLLLSTLEMESNMRLTIQEIIFKMHLEKATYDKAVDDIKNIFNLLRIQLQKMEEAIRRIRQNALSYTVAEYRTLLEENLSSLNDSKEKFIQYKNHVKDKIRELEYQHINIKKLEDKDKENLNNLKVIESYLNKSIDEQQRILSTHFDLKSIYTKELEEMTQMSIIKRFNLSMEVYEKVLKDATKLEDISILLNPLLVSPMEKSYNINKALQYQKPIKGKKEEDSDEFISVEDELYEEEERKRKLERLNKYKDCLKTIITLAKGNKGISLSKIKEIVEASEELRDKLIPTIEIFREVVVEMLKEKTILVAELKAEKSFTLQSSELFFQLNECILDLVENEEEFKYINLINATKLPSEEKVVFKSVRGENGIIKVVTCSDVYFEVE